MSDVCFTSGEKLAPFFYLHSPGTREIPHDDTYVDIPMEINHYRGEASTVVRRVNDNELWLCRLNDDAFVDVYAKTDFFCDESLLLWHSSYQQPHRV